MTLRYRVELSRDAVRALAKLDRPVRRRLQGAVDKLADDPRPPGMVALRGVAGAFRIRVGDYRVVYELHDDRLLVLVIEIGHRREIYRGL